ncbi:MAG: PorV/PorQ family protein [Candidatus Marinimicrobia bacterium]|nr:PorV/PorQ family protein [Candidatus Neomarinimicrobiota bacterium]
MKKTVLIILIITASLQLTQAQFDYGFDFTKAGSAGLQFLKIGVGARETAMGEAFVSLSSDVNAVFWNVAGIGFVTSPQLTFSHTNWLVESAQDAFAVALPIKSFVFGISAIGFKIQDFEETTVLEPYGTGNMIGAGDYLLGFAVARRYTDKLTIGLQLKYIQEVLDNRSFSNVLFDIGTIYRTGFRDLKLAFALQHFGPDMTLANQQFRTPLLFRVGASDYVFDTGTQSLIISAELVHPTDANEWINAGLEYTFMNILALRGGYQANDKEQRLTTGFGILAPAIGKVGTTFDYAYVSFGEIFGATHRFTIGLNF